MAILKIKDEKGNITPIPLIRGEKGKDGLTPFINENGNWQIGDTDTGIKAQGDIDINSLVGKKTDEGGEIFNFYDINQTSPDQRIMNSAGEYSSALNYGTDAAAKKAMAIGDQTTVFADIGFSSGSNTLAGYAGFKVVNVAHLSFGLKLFIDIQSCPVREGKGYGYEVGSYAGEKVGLNVGDDVYWYGKHHLYDVFKIRCLGNSASPITPTYETTKVNNIDVECGIVWIEFKDTTLHGNAWKNTEFFNKVGLDTTTTNWIFTDKSATNSYPVNNMIGATASGDNTRSFGRGASSNGIKTRARGDGSTTYGVGTETISDAQFASGTYNQLNSDALHIVGNGTDDDNRSNAFVVYKDGHAEVQTQGEANNSVATRGYVAEAIEANDATRIVEFDDGVSDYTLECTKDKNLKGLSILGKTEQDTFTGVRRTRNLIPFPYDYAVGEHTNYGVTLTVDDDGTIHITGYPNPYDMNPYPNYTLVNKIILTEGTYTFSGWSSDFTNGQISLYSEASVGISAISVGNFDGLTPTFTVPVGQTRTFYLSITLFGSNYTEENPANYTFKFQIEKGITATEYEPFSEDLPLETHEVSNPIQNPSVTIADTVFSFDGITLRGIPSESGWLVRDEILFKNGTIKLIQRVSEAIDNNNTSTIIGNTEFKLDEPIETDVTEQFKGLLDLRTEDLRTVVSIPSAGSITHVVDLANYIDNKFAKLEQAIISLGGNV